MWFDNNFQQPATVDADMPVNDAPREHAVAHASPLLQTTRNDRWVAPVFSSKPRSNEDTQREFQHTGRRTFIDSPYVVIWY